MEGGEKEKEVVEENIVPRVVPATMFDCGVTTNTPRAEEGRH